MSAPKEGIYVKHLEGFYSTAPGELAQDKFEEGQEYANTKYNAAIGLFQDILNTLKEMPDIDVTLPPKGESGVLGGGEQGQGDSGKDNFTQEELQPNINCSYLLNTLQTLKSSVPASSVIDEDRDDITEKTDELVSENSLSEYEETLYSSSLLTSLKNKLNTLISGTDDGFGATVEQEMFDMNSEAEKQALLDEKDRIASKWAERGFEIPGSGLFYLLAKADREYMQKKLAKSRSIAEASRKVAVDNMKAGIAGSIKTEAAYMKYKATYWQRKLEIAKAIFEKGVEVYKAIVAKLKSQMDEYSSEVQGFVAKVNATTSYADLGFDVLKKKYENDIEYINTKTQQILFALKEVEMKYGINLDAIKAEAQETVELAASALGAISVSARVATQYSESIQHQNELRETHNYQDEVQ